MRKCQKNPFIRKIHSPARMAGGHGPQHPRAPVSAYRFFRFSARYRSCGAESEERFFAPPQRYRRRSFRCSLNRPHSFQILREEVHCTTKQKSGRRIFKGGRTVLREQDRRGGQGPLLMRALVSALRYFRYSARFRFCGAETRVPPEGPARRAANSCANLCVSLLPL